MKKLFFGICLILQAGRLFACDACGASITSGYVGILPQFTRHFVGIKYQFRYFSSTSIGDPQGSYRNKEFYHTWNVWGRISPHKRVQILINVPVNYYLQHDQGTVRELSGPGDIWTLCQYQLVRTPDSLKKKVRQSLLVGGGIKLPTGRYNLYDPNGFYDRNMQPGTGSWDALFSSQYTIRWKGWGMNIESNARISTLNPDNYLYGHQVNGSLKGFYWGQKNKISYLVSSGVQYDYRSKDLYLHQFLPTTGGHLLSVTASADVYMPKWAIGLDFKIPLYAHMGGGLVNPGLQVSSQIMFMF
jgi:hypothetical protein